MKFNTEKKKENICSNKTHIIIRINRSIKMIPHPRSHVLFFFQVCFRRTIEEEEKRLMQCMKGPHIHVHRIERHV